MSGSRRIAYLMSWFPAVTETFILYEILELERLGMKVEVYPLFGSKTRLKHPGAEGALRRTHYQSVVSLSVLLAQLWWLWKAPRAYLSALWLALWGNRESLSFLVRALVVFPKAAWIARELKERRIDHVHAHWATHPTLAALIIQKLTRTPYSFTCHAHDLYVDRTMLREKIDAASFVVTISGYNRRLLASLYGKKAAEKIAVVRCGVDPNTFQPAAGRTSSDRLRMICVASLRDYKGHKYLIEACGQLKKMGLPFECWLVGEGPLRGALEEQIDQLKLNREVRLLGQQPQDSVSALVSQADVMVLPSIVTSNNQAEGIPVSLMEGLAVQLPVVATEISGIPELIEHERTGLLVPEKDVEALCGAIVRLAGDPALRHALGKAGRLKVLRTYDRSRNASLLHSMLEDGSVQPFFDAFVEGEIPLEPEGVKDTPMRPQL